MMKIDKLTILYVSVDTSLAGSSRSLINLIESVRDVVYPIVLLPANGAAYDYYTQRNIECVIHPFVSLMKYSRVDWKRLLTHPWRLFIMKYLRYELPCLFHIWRYLRKRHIDIVHTNNSPIIVGRKLAMIFHAKHVWHIREYLDLDFGREVYLGRNNLRCMLNHADARIAISTSLNAHWKLANNNTYILPNPICSSSDRVYWGVKEKYYLFCSYLLTEEKGARVAVSAFGMSQLSTKGYTLKLVGNCTDDYREQLIEEAKIYHSENAIEFVPCQPDVKQIFAKATAFIMSSKFEAFGRTTAEAMIWGCPVVAHATGGTLDLIKHQETGYLYQSVDECAELLKQVSVKNQESIILKAQQFAVDNFSQEVYGPKIMEVYNTILKNGLTDER